MSGVRIPLAWIRSRSGGVVLRVSGGVKVMRFTRGPLSPACRFNLRSHLRVEKNHGGIGAPRPTQPDACLVRFCGQCAAIENENTVLGRIVFPLRRKEATCMFRAMNFAIFKESFAISENEIDIPFDVAMREVFPRRRARFTVGPATTLVRGIHSVS